MLLPALQGVQSRIGWISEGAMDYVCERLNVPPADAWGVATFYALLSTSPRPRGVLHVCDDIACKARGADRICARLEQDVGPAHSHAPDGDHVELQSDSATWMRSPCLGMCDQAPAAFVQIAQDGGGVETLIGSLTPAGAHEQMRRLNEVLSRPAREVLGKNAGRVV